MSQAKTTGIPISSCFSNSAGELRIKDVRLLPELLAPAGDWECARAAVENGADAIYFGLERFNARMRAHNFTESDLPQLLEYLHTRGVRGYITFNTLVFENEMAEAEQYARSMIAAGVDAAIVQDVGICRLIRGISPDFPIHASTQMTVTSPEGVDFVRRLGCCLVVLARECSLADIEKIQAAQTRAASGPVPLEVFVHGALCVAYSGQCLTSEALGGRSANRGECAQACRMPYDLVADGKQVPLGDRKYLLSPQDLAAVDVLPELARLRLASLKIEGRLKSPEYVASITRIYREALDRIGHENGLTLESRRVENADRPASGVRYEMEMAFSRGLYTGWFRGTNNQELVHGRFGKKRGVFLGKVLEVRHDGVVIGLAGPLKPGDGVVFDAGRPEGQEQGGRVYQIRQLNADPRGNAKVHLAFGRDDVDLQRVHRGDRLWKTSDPELDRKLRLSFTGEAAKVQRPVVMEVHGSAGTPLSLLIRDEMEHVARIESQMPLAAAANKPLSTDYLQNQLGRLGGTPFYAAKLTNSLTGDLMLPVSELNRMRREAVSNLLELRARPCRWTINTNALERQATYGKSLHPATEPELVVLVRNLQQLQEALTCGVSSIYCDFEDPKKYREAVMHFRAWHTQTPIATGRAPSIWAAPPRVFKPGEEWTLAQTRSCEADGYLVRNYDHLRFFAADRRIGDYSLNVANRLSAEYFRNEFGLERVTASYDLNFAQLEALLTAAPPEWFEITVHQHMPMFHMEHCVFCAFLSTGTDYRNCGRPCDRHDLKLRDRVGAEHPVKADAGCRNTVFNSLAQTGAEYISQMLKLGVRRFRVEFVNEEPGQVRQVIGKYRQLLAGEISGAQLWKELKLLNQLGVTRGQIRS